MNWTRNFKDIIPTLHILFPQKSRGGNTSQLILWGHHYHDTKTIHKNYKKGKLQINVPMAQMKNWIQQYVKRVMYPDLVGFVPGMQSWFMFKSQSMYKQMHGKWNVVYPYSGLSARNRNGVYVTTWMKLKNIRLREGIQLQKTTKIPHRQRHKHKK